MPMSRKDELLKQAKLLYSQAEGRGSVKRSLRKLGDYYQREAERLSERYPISGKHKKHEQAA
jgi:hypothetical protein